MIADFDVDPLLATHKQFLTEHTPFKRGSDLGLVVNGWVLGPLEPNEEFTDSDFSLTERLALKLGLSKIQSLVTEWSRDG